MILLNMDLNIFANTYALLTSTKKMYERYAEF